jgi:hypothetical protein
VLVILLFELDDVLQHQLFLGGVLPVGQSGRILLLELSAPLELLVDDLLPPLEELQQLVVHFALHFKYNFKYDIANHPLITAYNKPIAMPQVR